MIQEKVPLCFDTLPRVTVTALPFLLLAGLLLPPGLGPKGGLMYVLCGLKHKHIHFGEIIPSFFSEEGDGAANTAADVSY